MESSQLANGEVRSPKRTARWLSLSGVALMVVASYDLPYPLGYVLGPTGFGLLLGGFLRWIHERSRRSAIQEDLLEQRQPWSRAETAGFVVEMMVAIVLVAIIGFVVVMGISFSEWEPGDGPGGWFSVAFFAYPVTALAFTIIAVRLWARRSPWAHAHQSQLLSYPWPSPG